MGEMLIRVAGEGGEGVISTGELLSQAAVRQGAEVFTFRTYPAEIKGGLAMFQIRVSDQPLLSQGDAVDVLVAFNEEGFDAHHSSLKEGGVLIYDADSVEVANSNPWHSYGIPMTEIAQKEIGSRIAKNVVAIGAVTALLGFDYETVDHLVRERWGRKGLEVQERNAKALAAGFRYIQEHFRPTHPYRIPFRQVPSPRIVVSGNDALCLGAIFAGVRVYAGYPITPASDIMHWMAQELPRRGGAMIQTEDEIAALALVLGASFAGQKAMTATSGPGLSLMVELIGLASMAEIPAVIVDVQRGGPSTGMPTKTENADLNLAVYGAHGDAPRIVIAPGTIEECFYLTVRAFDLAERYQSPVILLSDQFLAQSTQSIPFPVVEGLKVGERKRPDGTDGGTYQRYALTEDGISPMAIPGLDLSYYTLTGLEHDEYGHPNISPWYHTKMTEKRFRKYRQLSQEKGWAVRYGHEEPEVGIITWGSATGPVREAVEKAVAQGQRVAQLHVRLLHPLPVGEILNFVKPLRQVVVAELNFSGQLAHLIAAETGIQAERWNKYTGLPFSPEEIFEALEQVYQAAA